MIKHMEKTMKMMKNRDKTMKTAEK